MNAADVLPGWLTRTPTGRKILEEEAAEQTSDREAVIAELEAVGQERAATLPDLREAVQEAEAEAREAWEAYATADEARHRASNALMAATSSLEARRDRLQARLRQMADPRIEAAIAELQELWLLERRTPADITAGPRNHITGQTVNYSNYESVQARVMAIRAAIAELEALKVDPSADVPARIAEIRDSIPERAEPGPPSANGNGRRK